MDIFKTYDDALRKKIIYAEVAYIAQAYFESISEYPHKAADLSKTALHIINEKLTKINDEPPKQDD